MVLTLVVGTGVVDELNALALALLVGLPIAAVPAMPWTDEGGTTEKLVVPYM